MKFFVIGLLYAVMGMILRYLHTPDWVFGLVFFAYGSLVTAWIFTRKDKEDEKQIAEVKDLFESKGINVINITKE